MTTDDWDVDVLSNGCVDVQEILAFLLLARDFRRQRDKSLSIDMPQRDLLHQNPDKESTTFLRRQRKDRNKIRTESNKQYEEDAPQGACEHLR